MITKSEFEDFCKDYDIKLNKRRLYTTDCESMTIHYKLCEKYKPYYLRRPCREMLKVNFGYQTEKYTGYNGYKDYAWTIDKWGWQEGTGYGCVYIPEYLGDMSSCRLDNMIEKAIVTGRLDMLEIILCKMPVQNIKEMRNYVDLNLKITDLNYKLLQNEGIKNAIDKFAENRAHITLLEENNNQLKEKIKLQIEKLSNINKDEE